MAGIGEAFALRMVTIGDVQPHDVEELAGTGIDRVAMVLHLSKVRAGVSRSSTWLHRYCNFDAGQGGIS